VDLVARHRMTTAIKPQLRSFLEGFWELVPRHLIAIFNDHELELLISGLPDIDVADLRANCEYHGYSANAPAIRWFWEVGRRPGRWPLGCRAWLQQLPGLRRLGCNPAAGAAGLPVLGSGGPGALLGAWSDAACAPPAPPRRRWCLRWTSRTRRSCCSS
jgi:hypothetical protein